MVQHHTIQDDTVQYDVILVCCVLLKTESLDASRALAAAPASASPAEPDRKSQRQRARLALPSAPKSASSAESSETELTRHGIESAPTMSMEQARTNGSVAHLQTRSQTARTLNICLCYVDARATQEHRNTTFINVCLNQEFDKHVPCATT